MTATIEIKADIDPQEVYDELTIYEQREFLNSNIDDLKDEDLIGELENRGYNMEEVSK